MSKPIVVIGSGPSGAVAAHFAVKSGRQVLMLDAGNAPEDEIRDLMYRPSEIEKERFLGRVYENRKRSLGNKGGIPEKLAFGSMYPYRPFNGSSPSVSSVVQENGVSFVTSHALGGLSTVWGATVAALSPGDTENWPIDVSVLTPYFEQLRELVDLSAENDALDLLYPLAIASESQYELGVQGRHLLNHMGKSRDRLLDEGMYFGRAKLAVGKKYAANEEGCVRCGLCMHGCPYNAIFNSADVVTALKSSPLFEYHSGVFVRRFLEKDDGVEIECQDQTGTRFAVDAERVFVGGGVIGSTALISRSMNWSKKSYRIRDSQKYMFFFRTTDRIRGAVSEDANSLSQVYIEIRNPEISNRLVHVQLYGYSDIFVEPLRKFLPEGIMRHVPKLSAPIFERLMVGMMYLHSDDSGYLEFTPSDTLEENQGRVTGELSRRGKEVFSNIQQLTVQKKKLLGGSILNLGVQSIPCGKSQHFGSSLPMSVEPEEGQTDLLGRPFGTSRVHVVDGSVLPTVPGTPTTYPTMANAARIVDEALSLAI